jgi:hypothetical protein
MFSSLPTITRVRDIRLNVVVGRRPGDDELQPYASGGIRIVTTSASAS